MSIEAIKREIDELTTCNHPLYEIWVLDYQRGDVGSVDFGDECAGSEVSWSDTFADWDDETSPEFGALIRADNWLDMV